MSRKKISAMIMEQQPIAMDIFSMWLESDEIAKGAKPGQFVSLYCRDGSRLLPRPISICETDKKRGVFRIVYRVAGEGTKEFSVLHAGERVDLLGPLGNGFPLTEKKAFLIGGGIGIPPMLELAKTLPGEKEIVLGYRDMLFLNEEFEKYGRVTIATEDGSAGTKGNVLDAVRSRGLSADVLYACGPTPMLKALQAYAAEQEMEAWLSLEERMACGVGACLACVCETKEIDEHSHVKNRRICKDGPVFRAGEVEL